MRRDVRAITVHQQALALPENRFRVWAMFFQERQRLRDSKRTMR